MLDEIIARRETVYGVNTGFGHPASTAVGHEEMVRLQVNIIRSHCCCVGEMLPRQTVLCMWLLRLQALCQGHSGVRIETVQGIVRLLEAGVLACVPSRGSVGASGDLAPAAHAVRAILGEGPCTMPWRGEIVRLPAAEALRRVGMAPLTLGPKEGLSLVNGTCLTTALAVEVWCEGEMLVRLANLTAALTMIGLGASPSLCAEPTLRAHRHPGTWECGSQMARWLEGSSGGGVPESCGTVMVQDPYSFRCAPQVHGAVWEEVEQTRGMLEAEINAVTDNPLLFPETGQVLNGGNFHAIYPARVCDRLASAFTTLACIAERRISQAMGSRHHILPAFLVHNGGLNSGFMMAQVTAAALASECKALSFPASVDSIPTNCNQEDHVSMGPTAGLKARQVMRNVRHVLAIELMVAVQAIDMSGAKGLSQRLGWVCTQVRHLVPFLDEDRALSEDIELLASHLETFLQEPPHG